MRIGSEADFVILDLKATPLIARRTSESRTLAEKLLVIMTLGGERVGSRTYVLGRLQCQPTQRPNAS